MNIMTRMPVLDQEQDLAFTLSCSAVADDALRVHSFTALEAISAPYEVHLDLASMDPQIDLHGLIDTPASLNILHKYDAPRHLAGVIVAAERRGQGAHRTFYRLVLMPSLHRLRFGSDCRIFQQKSVPDIIKALLSEHRIGDVKWSLKEQHVAREYCVQYRETHLDFIDRLAAEEGIFYYFQHGENGHHTLIFTDFNEGCDVLEHAPEITYNAMPGGATKSSFVRHFTIRERLRSTSYMQRDYTFKNPRYDQQHRHHRQEDNGSRSDYAMYDYPGRYKRDVAGKPFTKYRMERSRVDATTGQGTTNNIHFCAGHRFDLKKHDVEACNRRYLIRRVNHSGTQPQVLEEEAGDGATTYHASFTVMPSTLSYRSPLRVKPVVDGPQMAHVVGPKGEEIYTDEWGRVKVTFPWDRYSGKNEHSSCWIRVAQNWGGTMWGHMAIPRIGHEVIVDFLEGDPDQPIITGRTYHAQNKPPYKLPDHKTKMVIRSDSHKSSGYNEISFEDEGGQENIFVHAQKDQTLKVLNNRAKRVNNNQVESVGANKNIEVGANHAEKIGGSMNISVGGGSGGALMGALGAVLAAGGKDMSAGAGATGNGAIGKFAGALAAVGAASESASLGGNAGFNAAGGHFAEAGKAQQGTAAAIGGMLAKIMPMSGIVSAVIEKFSSTTVGIAATEQIGMMKNTSVGHTQTTQVGKFKKTIVGDEYVIEVGKSKMIMKKDGTVIIKGVTFHFEADGHFQQLGKVIDLN